MAKLIIRGLTLWRPWPWCITKLGKDIENRGWAPPKWMIGQFLAIHAGKKLDKETMEDIAEEFDVNVSLEEQCEGIVAVCRLKGVVTASESRWYNPSLDPDDPTYGWQLGSVVPLRNPIACKGAQGLWVIPDDVLTKLRVEYEASKRALKAA